jgi:hypothetical protein
VVAPGAGIIPRHQTYDVGEEPAKGRHVRYLDAEVAELQVTQHHDRRPER